MLPPPYAQNESSYLLPSAPPSNKSIVLQIQPVQHIQSNTAPYICIKCNNCCGFICNCCDNMCEYIYNKCKKWITLKTVGFTLLFLMYISFPISEIVYGQVIPTNIYCDNGTPIDINTLHSLDIRLWLLIDSVCLIVVLLISLLFSYIDDKWNLDHIESMCIFLLTILFIFVFVWTIVGSVLLAKTFAPCKTLGGNNTATVMIIRLLFGGAFYVGSLITAIIFCYVA